MAKEEKKYEGDFETALKQFVKATQNSAKFARICAQMALEHFSANGDLSRCQQFFDNMTPNYVRRAAYVAWLVAFAPIKMEKGKFTKDKAREGFGKGEGPVLSEEQLAAAFKKDFWDFAPESEIRVVTALDFDKALIAFIARWTKENKHQKHDMPTTLRHILDIEEVVKSKVLPDALPPSLASEPETRPSVH